MTLAVPRDAAMLPVTLAVIQEVPLLARRLEVMQVPVMLPAVLQDAELLQAFVPVASQAAMFSLPSLVAVSQNMEF